MTLVRPIPALRVLTSAVILLLIAELFARKDTFLAGFLLGAAIGISIGVQVMVWNKQLKWQDQAPPDDTVRLNLGHPQR